MQRGRAPLLGQVIGSISGVNERFLIFALVAENKFVADMAPRARLYGLFQQYGALDWYVRHVRKVKASELESLVSNIEPLL